MDLAAVGRAFDGPTLEDVGLAHSGSEDRWRLIGMLDDRCITVIYTFREGAIRLITARRAEPEEEFEFENHLMAEIVPDEDT